MSHAADDVIAEGVAADGNDDERAATCRLEILLSAFIRFLRQTRRRRNPFLASALLLTR